MGLGRPTQVVGSGRGGEWLVSELGKGGGGGSRQGFGVGGKQTTLNS